MKVRPLSPALANGLAKSAASATRAKGASGVPSTSSRTSLIQSRRGPREPMWPTIGRVAHLPCMPSRESVGTGMSAGRGTSQFGGDQMLPCGFSVRRNNWQEARAIATPPERKSASITRMRKPSRTVLVFTSIGAVMFGRRNMSTVSRAGTKPAPPWRCSMTKASRPITTRPCSEFGSHGPLAIGLGRKLSASRRKKAWLVMVRDHGGFCAPGSRAAKRVSPFHQHILVRLGGARFGEYGQCARVDELR